MISYELYNSGARRWVYFGRDPDRPAHIIDTNQYLITNEGEALLPDPGGMEIFPSFLSVLSQEIDVKDISALFGSHQDPDIISSLSLWSGICEDLQVYVPGIWSTFIPHFSEDTNLISVPDEGREIPLGGSSDLRLIPAHYLHSSANFSLYDPVARILFSGDIGAALLPENHNDIFVTDFKAHVPYMAGFHRRWMPSDVAKNDWIKRVRELDIQMMCPQHGSIFKGDDVKRFLDWFEELEVASAINKDKV